MISIIIPNLNSPVIGETLDSVRRQVGEQTSTSVEVIVVGMDRHGLVSEDHLVKFIRTGRPVWPSVARNIGYRASSGEILVFLDADCIASDGWLAGIQRRFEDPSVWVLAGGVRSYSTDYIALSDHVSSFYQFLDISSPGPRDHLASINLAMRRQAWEEVGGFDESRATGEDTLLTAQLYRRGITLHFDPRLWVWHRPGRVTVRDLWRHAWSYGRYSIRVDRRLRSLLRVPWAFRRRLTLLAAAPFYAVGVTAKIFLINPPLLNQWYLFPAIFSAKIAWCLGASESLRQQTSRSNHGG
jgi:glycosyltransferase involved in cell wall biosynthesis